MTIDELKQQNEQLKKDISYFKRLYENKLHETHDWIKVALNRQNIIDELGGKLHKNDDHFVDVAKKLDIAVKALEKYKIEDETNNISEDVRFAEIALAKIKELSDVCI